MGPHQKYQLQVSSSAGAPHSPGISWTHTAQGAGSHLQLGRSLRPTGTCPMGCRVANMPSDHCTQPVMV